MGYTLWWQDSHTISSCDEFCISHVLYQYCITAFLNLIEIPQFSHELLMAIGIHEVSMGIEEPIQLIIHFRVA